MLYSEIPPADKIVMQIDFHSRGVLLALQHRLLHGPSESRRILDSHDCQ